MRQQATWFDYSLGTSPPHPLELREGCILVLDDGEHWANGLSFGQLRKEAARRHLPLIGRMGYVFEPKHNGYTIGYGGE